MTSNVDMQFDVRGLTGDDQAQSVFDAVLEVLTSGHMDRDVMLNTVEQKQHWSVEGKSEGSLYISSWGRWHEGFEESLRRCVAAVARVGRMSKPVGCQHFQKHSSADARGVAARAGLDSQLFMSKEFRWLRTKSLARFGGLAGCCA
ncbi:hypothetical protein ACFVUS_07100 [Nocardia sp. NPDC058058]|uniref:hypothetical protein n=1 Tax=Nocardia sp. NPDC058058 TaxID=3346317 RepID=UPI0036DEB003